MENCLSTKKQAPLREPAVTIGLSRKLVRGFDGSRSFDHRSRLGRRSDLGRSTLRPLTLDLVVGLGDAAGQLGPDAVVGQAERARAIGREPAKLLQGLTGHASRESHDIGASGESRGTARARLRRGFGLLRGLGRLLRVLLGHWSIVVVGARSLSDVLAASGCRNHNRLIAERQLETGIFHSGVLLDMPEGRGMLWA